MAKDAEVTLTFYRNALSDFPDKLSEYAARQTDPNLKKSVQDCASVFRGWLSGNCGKIRCTRSEASWGRLPSLARSAGAMTLAKVIELKLEQWRLETEAAAERKGAQERTALAMAEFRQGGGES